MQNLKSKAGATVAKNERRMRAETWKEESAMHSQFEPTCVCSETPQTRKSEDGVLKLHDSCSNYQTFYTT